jgi:hypothetical protein
MATVKVKVRALNKGALDRDIVVIKNRGNGMERFAFEVSPLGTVDADVKETEVDAIHEVDFKAAIAAKRGVTIENNPKWEDVKTDSGADGDTTADDGINDGTRYGWSKEGVLYEIV